MPHNADIIGPISSGQLKLRVSLVGVPLVALAVAMFTQLTGRTELWANAYWTFGAVAGLFLSFSPVTAARTRQAVTFVWLLRCALLLYACGQILWSILVWRGIAEVPSPADLFFLASCIPVLGVFALFGWLHLNNQRLIASYIDLTVTLLALTVLFLAFMRPSAASAGRIDLLVQYSYPILFLTPSIGGLVLAIAVPSSWQWRGFYLLIAGWLILGVAFSWWTIVAIELAPAAGAPADYLFSIGLVLTGIAAALWNAPARTKPLIDPRRLFLISDSLSVLISSAATFAALFGIANSRTPYALAAVTAALIVLVGIRQILLTHSTLSVERNLAELVDALPTMVRVTDTRGHIRLWNRAAEALTGTDRRQVLSHPRDDCPAGEVLELDTHSSASEQTEMRLFRGADREHTVEWKRSEPFDQRLNWKTLEVGIDVTDRLKQQAEQTALERELERTRRLEAVGRLAGGIAHDFNNLLTIVRGNLDLIAGDLSNGKGADERAGVSDSVDESIQDLRLATDRAADLVRRLMTFSGRERGTPEHNDLNEVLENLAPMLQRLVGPTIDLQLHLATGTCPVIVDRAHLDQVVMNLVINAKEAMPRGGALVLTTHSSQELVELIVEDDGCGISDSDLEKIFEPFFSTKRETGGNGLGLATVYGILQQSSGEIDVQSEPGRGTRFRVRLPASSPSHSRAASGIRKAETEILSASTEAAPPVSRSDRTILIVDDEPAIRRLLEQLCERLGHRVLLAEDGIDGLETAQRHDGSIDLVVTDLMMPRMTGLQMALRLSELRPDIKVLMLSGHFTQPLGQREDAVLREQEAQLRERIATLKLSKPFQIDELEQSVSRLLADNS